MSEIRSWKVWKDRMWRQKEHEPKQISNEFTFPSFTFVGGKINDRISKFKKIKN